MKRFKQGRVAMACAAFVIAIGGTAAAVTSATSAHASATEVLAYANQAVQNHTQFRIYSTGSGNTATGLFSFWQKGSPTTTTGWRWVTATVTCSTISGNDAILTGTAVVNGSTETVVAEAVDNTSPSSSGNPDRIRFSFAPTITPVSP